MTKDNSTQAEAVADTKPKATTVVGHYMPESVVAALDDGHPGKALASPARYDMATEQNRLDLENLRVAKGVLDQIPKGYIVDGKIIIAEGSRRTYLLRAYNKELKEQRKARVPMPVYIDFAGGLAEAVDAHAGINAGSLPDDPLTRALKMKDQLTGRPGAEAGTWLVPPRPLAEVARRFRVVPQVVEDVTDPRRGLLALSPACQAAVAAGHISQSTGLHLSNIRPELTQAAREALQDRTLAKLLHDSGGKKPDNDSSRALARNLGKAVKQGDQGAIDALLATDGPAGQGANRPDKPKDVRPTRRMFGRAVQLCTTGGGEATPAIEAVRALLQALEGSQGKAPLLACKALPEDVVQELVAALFAKAPKGARAPKPAKPAKAKRGGPKPLLEVLGGPAAAGPAPKPAKGKPGKGKRAEGTLPAEDKAVRKAHQKQQEGAQARAAALAERRERIAQQANSARG